jgi:hypothetical protein
MPIRRRDFILSSAIGGARIARAQSLSRYNLEALIFSTTKTTGADPSITKSGRTLLWAWGDGTYTTSNAPGKTYPAGTKKYRLITFDTFAGVTVMNFNSKLMIGAFPSLARVPNLTTGQFYSNAFSGSLPSFQNNTKLTSIDIDTNSFSGVIPSFAACNLLISFQMYSNGFTGSVAGSFATQKSMSLADFHGNALTQAAVDQILADFVTSLGISGRVHNTVNLTGGTNAAPSTTGLANAATLNTAGWTVTHN